MTESPIRLDDLLAMKKAGEPIASLTAYEASFARLMDRVGVDIILVGDSLGMVVQGHDTTLPVSIDDMVYHTRCVRRGVERALVMADMPFASYECDHQTLETAERLVEEGGATAVKIEVDEALLPAIAALSSASIPVCAHIGLLPQQQYQQGQIKTPVSTPQSDELLLAHALDCVKHGADLLLAECIDPAVAKEITAQTQVPLIGIGSGADCDGQILVMHDVIGISHKKPKFARNFLTDAGSVEAAFANYVAAVKNKTFPGGDEKV